MNCLPDLSSNCILISLLDIEFVYKGFESYENSILDFLYSRTLIQTEAQKFIYPSLEDSKELYKLAMDNKLSFVMTEKKFQSLSKDMKLKLGTEFEPLKLSPSLQSSLDSLVVIYGQKNRFDLEILNLMILKSQVRLLRSVKYLQSTL